ncbi:MAG: DUF3298 domain-containing protein [Dokdonia sp.]
MKTLLPVLFMLLMVSSCKQNNTKPAPDSRLQTFPRDSSLLDKDSADSLYLTNADIRELQAQRQQRKKEGLLAIPDDKIALENTIETKTITLTEDEYVLDYTYPYLDPSRHPSFKTFNDYMQESYLNTEQTINEILEDKELLCDTLNIQRFRDKRIIDFKVFSTANNLLSVLLYKENYYSGMIHSAYMFDCLNFDIEKNEFIYFNDFFVEGAQQEVLTMINSTIDQEITSGQMYYDCWELSKEDFMAYRDNFVVDGDHISFYFDDCVICPSYTGTYAVAIPVTKMLHLIKEYQKPILL